MHYINPDSATGSITGMRIAVIIYNYQLGVSPSITNSISILARNNRVEVLTSPVDQTAPPAPPWLANHISSCKRKRSFILFRICRLFARFLYTIPGNKKFDMIRWHAANLDLLWFSRWIGRRHSESPFDIYIPVEASSLIALDLSGVKDAEVIYYDMELLDWPTAENRRRGQQIQKELAYRALARVDHVMITSPKRARAFAKINDYPDDHISIIPTVPMADAENYRSIYFREKFRIPDDKRIILYSGNFQPWAQCIEILASMHLWPKNTVLVMHTWNRDSLHSKYFVEMRKVAADFPVHFSSEFIPSDELTSALSSADIGLLFYDSIDANFTEILFSSNKMGEYLAANLPVICSPHPSLSEFTQAHGIGIASDFNGIGKSIESILLRLDDYRENVRRCRERHFQFESYFTKAYSEFAEISHRNTGIRECRRNCSICGNTMTRAFSSRVLNRYHATYHRCTECGFMQAENPVWLEEAYRGPIVGADTGLVSRNMGSAAILATLLSLCFDRRAAYLDIGGSHGLLTRLMRDRGFDCYWHDPYCQNLMARGFNAEQSARPFAALIAFEVIHRTPDPLQFIRDHLKKFNCSTMLFSTVLYEGESQPPKDWWYYSFNTGQHISFFQEKTLLAMARRLELNFYSVNGIHILTDKCIAFPWQALCGNKLFAAAIASVSRITLTDRDHYLLDRKCRDRTDTCQ